MILLLAFCCLCHGRCVAFATDTHPLLAAVDGDTLRVGFPELPEPLGPVLRLRLRHIDAPEIFHPSCEQERQWGNVARDFVADVLLRYEGRLTLNVCGWDKYGARVLGEVYVNCPGGHAPRSLAEMLMASGLARPYEGRGPKPASQDTWCDDLAPPVTPFWVEMDACDE